MLRGWANIFRKNISEPEQNIPDYLDILQTFALQMYNNMYLETLAETLRQMESLVPAIQDR